MHRLFAAIRPPSAVREVLMTAMGGVDTARWQDDELLHVTLRFIGEVNSRTADDIAAALQTLSAPPMTLAVDGVGSFAKRGRVHTLWARVTPAEPLIAMHRKIDRAMVTLGLPPESRTYHPHITLARFGAQGGDVAGYVATHAALKTPAFEASEFHLYESRLGSGGPSYDKIASYPLTR